jgi:tRNA (guanine37-N1)-methyltransferase
VYSRPEIFNSKRVPDELLSGNHALIKEWKDNQSLIRTYRRRPELINNIKLTKKQKKLLEELASKDIL